MTTKHRCETCGSQYETYCALCSWFDGESCEVTANYSPFDGIHAWQTTRAEFTAISLSDTEPSPALEEK